jgi:hypothetical protein
LSSDRSTVREIAWSEVFPWLSLFSAARLAVNLRSMVLAFIGLLLTGLGWAVVGQILPEGVDGLFGGRILPSPTDQAVVLWNPGVSLRPASVTAWDQVTGPFVAGFNRYTSLRVFAYLTLCGVWAIGVWALIGGAIARQAAVALARDERISLGQSINYARGKWKSTFAAPMLPLLGVVLTTIPLALFGLLLRVNALSIVAAMVWPLVLVAGLAMAVLMIGLLFGWPLMWATIGVEGTDSFDALSRSYAYVYQRPLHYLFYAAVAIAIGSIGAVLVSMFAHAVLMLSEWSLSWGSGNDNLDAVLAPGDAASGVVRAAAAIINVCRSCVVLFGLAYLSSYLWTAAVAIYYLLRRNVDATELTEVYMPEEDHDYGLPPLKHDAAGVPMTADESSRASGGDGAQTTFN